MNNLQILSLTDSLRKQFPEIFQFAENHYAGMDSAHDFKHGRRVLANAYAILMTQTIHPNNEDLKEFTAIMLLHDIRDHKAVRDGFQCVSAEELTEFYKQQGLNVGLINFIHDHSSWSKRHNSRGCESIGFPEKEPLRIILQDADWIEAMVVQRCRDYTVSRMPTSSEEEIAAEVYKHCVEKLQHVFGELHHNASRALAAQLGRVADLYGWMAEYEANK